jgi:coproporphyrinogen III oxidase-like Fe-S oxidoreductase
MESGRSPVEETVELSDHAAAGEAVYLGLRLHEGVDLLEISRQHGVEMEALHGEALERFAVEDLVDWEPATGRLKLTRRGRLLSNEVFLEFTV